jgi:hypothetical protein
MFGGVCRLEANQGPEFISGSAPTASPQVNAASPDVTPPAATDTPYTGPQGDGEFGGGPGDLARRAGNAAGGAPPGSLPMPTAQSPNPMTPDEALASTVVLETLSWIEHHELGKSDDEMREVKDSLLLAGRLICEDFRRRF